MLEKLFFELTPSPHFKDASHSISSASSRDGKISPSEALRLSSSIFVVYAENSADAALTFARTMDPVPMPAEKGVENIYVIPVPFGH